ncbi:MAG: hypothetical protein LUG56_02770 [Lachnospiraceae bacterium]|nr:hypothetical protein [Lachnospiraceae bacterium]
MQRIKRIAAMIGVILLVGMYVATLILSLSSSPQAQNLLMASIVCTVVVPVLIYAMELVARVLGPSDKEEPPVQKPDTVQTKTSQKKNASSDKKKHS